MSYPDAAEQAPRPINSGTITFGLVSLPVRIFPSTDAAATVPFNLFHRACGTRVRQRYVCPRDGVVVEGDDLARGYELEDGQYVLFAPGELEALEERVTNEIAIREFVPADAIDRRYLEKTYYLGPDRGGDRVYALFREALGSTDRVGVGQYAVRGRQYLVAVRPHGEHLVLEQLRYAEELRPTSAITIPPTESQPAELQLARQLIHRYSSEQFRPAGYYDHVKTRVLEAVRRKAEGREIVTEPPPREAPRVLDLMEALRASLEAPNAPRGDAPPSRERTRRARRSA
jgi:DNA end-binding protein Ku